MATTESYTRSIVGSVRCVQETVGIPETGSFLLIESLIHEKNTSRIIHILRPSETVSHFKLGRGHESDVRISDISVSRVHASIKCLRNGYYIEAVSYTHLRAHETSLHLVCRLLLEKKKIKPQKIFLAR
eukprot:TRINITY_DN10533_c0_g1_i1.p1 TRINITY_DN10533_c0_g1~~TRINITY_DN10533_c0_g1_i1.p1  ORF type:complete len:129 (+),score=23.59 TRINITY_DN10533_c0_g1_i1:66-452(+)